MTTSSSSENVDMYHQTISLLDSIRYDLFIMESGREDKTDEIIDKLYRLKEYNIYEA